MTGFTIHAPPPNVGGYRIGHSATGKVVFYFAKRPNWLHRTMARLLLGWVWEDFDVH